jgi:molybdopterin-guanine dinucleotide biosynthesis protein A
VSAPRASAERFAGLVLAGGKSSRMGQAKALLPFGPELLLPRVVRILSQVVSPIVVVAAEGQELPELPAEVRTVRDRRAGRGPLEGLATGLAALAEECDAAFVSGCDAPLLTPAFVRRVIERLGEREAAVPHIGGRFHPLAAVYRPRVVREIEGLLALDRLRPVFLYEQVPTRVLGPEDLADTDPEFRSLLNLNEPADYHAALALAGFPPPESRPG